MDKRLGIYDDLSFKDYRAMLEAVSISELNTFNKAPACYEHEYIKGLRKPGSEAQELGTHTHAYVLEPGYFAKHYRVATKHDRRTTAGKLLAQKQEEIAEQNGHILLSQQDYDTVRFAGDSLLAHGFVKEHLPHAICESSMFWVDPTTDVYCKGRLDAYVNDFGVLDLKTTKSVKDFEKSIPHWGYHRQAAYYSDALHMIRPQKKRDFYFMTVELEAPYLCKVVMADPAMISIGRNEYMDLLAKFARCKAENRWPGLSQHVEIVSLPPWYGAGRAIDMRSM
jgi:hypothetical protein